ncbi:MAG: DUF4145 domain-containing protein [Cyanobacteria bacterium]|nr:DUF4145 domain-containing protein [Cyanobacteriota bacterium]
MKTARHFCNDCKKETNHEAKGDPIFHSSDAVTWELWQCSGCEDVFLQKQIISTKGIELDEENEEPETEIQFERIPPKLTYPLPSWINNMQDPQSPANEQEYLGQVNTSVSQLMKEIYIALNHNALNLACTGLRTVLDCVFRDKVGNNVRKYANFGEKLEAMIAQHLITPDQKEILDSVIKMGNASAHNGHTPKPHILNQALQITEHLLIMIYIHPQQAESLRSSIPSVR